MKKLFLSLMLSVFLISSVSAAVCSPDSGLDWCYDYHDTRWSDCYSKVQGTEPKCQGVKVGSYCAGSWYIDVKHEGEKFYLYKQQSSWVSCDSEGCPGQEINDGKIILKTGVGPVPKYILNAWDYNEESDGSWCWNNMGGGYLGSDFFSKWGVECVDDSSCGAGKYCDTSDKSGGNAGGWQNWVCKIKECDSGQEKCIGSNLNKCENSKWQDKGVSLGQCGYCQSDNDCSESPESQSGKFSCEESICVWNQTWYSKFWNWAKSLFSNFRWF